MSIDDANREAIGRIERLARGGMLAEAEAECREVLARAPQEYRAWCLLGLVKLAAGQGAEAEAALLQATQVFPHDGRYWNSLSLALRMQSRLVEAEAAAVRAVRLNDVGDHWSELGHCLFGQQKWEAAASAYEQAVARIEPDAAVWTNFGAALQSLGRLDRAEQAYVRALALAPEDPNASLRLALLKIQRGEIKQGVELTKGVLERMPDLAPAWLILGNAERLRDNLEESEAAYRRAVELTPKDHDARYNLALVLLQRLRLDEAGKWIEELIEENPGDADSWIVLGGTLHAQARIEEAIDALRRGVELLPNPGSHSKLLMALPYSMSMTSEKLLEEHRAWDERYARMLTPVQGTAGRASSGAKLRLGFVGLDFSSGPTGFLGLRAMEALDKSQCDVVCYSDRAWKDEYTMRFGAAADEWRVSQSWTDEELAQQVRRDDIDVLVDLGGHVGRRLLVFARRPAALQVTWLGYVGTTGLTEMDGLIADRFHVREGEERWYSEAVLRMPHDYICYGPPPDAPAIGRLPALGSRRVTFGSFNNPAKYSPAVVDSWGEILRRVPSANLYLKYGGLDQPNIRRRLVGEFEKRGIASERLAMEGWSTNVENMARYNRVDLALDSHPYSGGLTTCEALWMGVPVVTCPGSCFASRHSTSPMTNAGYGQFVAPDLSSYVELAVEWAGRLDELAAMRSQMREQVARSPLCDGEGFARAMLGMLREAWEKKVRS
jgi:protein O-GlcNAc transferase